MKTIQGTIAEIKREILHDVRMGDMPIDVKNFGELHDYRDANCYGGFCDDALSDEMIAYFGGRDSDEGMPDGMLAYINECQMAIDAWLRSGGLRRMFLEHDQEDVEQWANAYGHLLRKHKALVRALDTAQAELRSTLGRLR